MPKGLICIEQQLEDAQSHIGCANTHSVWQQNTVKSPCFAPKKDKQLLWKSLRK